MISRCFQWEIPARELFRFTRVGNEAAGGFCLKGHETFGRFCPLLAARLRPDRVASLRAMKCSRPCALA
jgi:hypothetical protein